MLMRRRADAHAQVIKLRSDTLAIAERHGLRPFFEKCNNALPPQYRAKTAIELADQLMYGVNFAGFGGTSHGCWAVAKFMQGETNDVPADAVAFPPTDQLVGLYAQASPRTPPASPPLYSHFRSSSSYPHGAHRDLRRTPSASLSRRRGSTRPLRPPRAPSPPPRPSTSTSLAAARPSRRDCTRARRTSTCSRSPTATRTNSPRRTSSTRRARTSDRWSGGTGGSTSRPSSRASARGATCRSR